MPPLFKENDMNNQPSVKTLDQWASWLLHQRFATCTSEERAEAIAILEEIRDRIIYQAGIGGNEIVLDVGAGTGLLTWGAARLITKPGFVIASDVSKDSVTSCIVDRDKMGVEVAVDGLVCDARRLSVGDETVDTIVLRSVLLYIKEKVDVFKEMYRVLRPSGVLSFFEPINKGRHHNVDLNRLPIKVKEKVITIEQSTRNSRLNNVEWETTDFANALTVAGFTHIEFIEELAVDPLKDIEAVRRYLERVPAPGHPSIAELYKRFLNPEEWAAYAKIWFDTLEQGPVEFRTPTLYGRARKPKYSE